MSPQARTGIIAVAIVGGLFLACGGGVAAIVLAKRDKGTGGGSSGEVSYPEPSRFDPKSDPEGYARNHRWWAKPLTNGQLEELLKAMVNANGGNVVWFNNSGRFEVDRQKPNEFQDVFKNLGSDKLGSVRLEGPKRWDREHALTALIASLDDVEFRRGPAKR